MLALESCRHPLHIASLQVFTPPDGAGPDFVQQTYEAMRSCKDVAPVFAGHPATTRRGTSRVRWTYDEDIDLDYHLRRTTLPAPGGDQELFDVVSRVHSALLDRRRPLWEMHLIDGFRDGRFAIYTKTHHALFDGMSGLSLLQKSLSADPDDDELRVLWSQLPKPRGAAEAGLSRRRRVLNSLKSVAKLGSAASVLRAGLSDRELMPVFRAPRSIFNRSGGGPRHSAVQSWGMGRIKAVKDATGVTVNDVALAMCSGALRSYLAEHDALPDVPLVAMAPVSLRNASDAEDRNLLGSALCNLATHLDDPAIRLKAIHASMQYNKQVIRALPQQVALQLAGVVCLPVSDGTGIGRSFPTMFNVAVSHIPGAKAMYYNGARRDSIFALPPTLRGQTLNFGVISSASNLDVAIVGCADAVPDLKSLLVHLDSALEDLERAVGL